MGFLDLFKKKTILKPGEHCTQSGQWTWSQPPHDQDTCNKGEPMGPPPKANWGQTGGYWRLTDATRTSHRR
jgi:hypothetical protein